ncbi:hypothetical protein [Streptomyces sp. NPDC021622]
MAAAAAQGQEGLEDLRGLVGQPQGEAFVQAAPISSLLSCTTSGT